MKLRLLVGEEGTVRDQALYHGMDRCEGRTLLIVPERFTLEAERALVEEIGLPGLFQMEVLSFTRLGQKVLARTRGTARTYMNETGKAMLMRRAVNGVQDRLAVYGGAARQEGFLDALGRIFTQLKRFDVDEKALLNTAKELDDELLGRKLQDLALLFGRYQELFSRDFLDEEDLIAALAEAVGEDPILAQTDVFLGSFDNLPPRMLRVVDALMRSCPSVTVSLTLNPDHARRDGDLYFFGETTRTALLALAQAANVPVEEVVVRQRQKKARDIRHLERELFRYPYRAYEGEGEGVELFAGTNRYEEVQRVAQRILQLVQEEGYRFSDVAVIATDLEAYGGMLAQTFAEYGVAAFVDGRRPLLGHPAARLILSAVASAARGYPLKEVLAAAKTGLTDLDGAETEELENYALRFNLRGGGWTEPFQKGREEYDLEGLEGMRRRLVEPMERLHRALVEAKGSARSMAEAVHGYLAELDVAGKLTDWAERDAAAGYLSDAKENAQVLEDVVGLLRQMATFLGEYRLSMKSLHQMLKSGFSALSLGLIPPAADQVLIGSLGRSKSRPVKALFIVGANEGLLPKSGGDGALLEAFEQTELMKNGLCLGGDDGSLTAQERLGIYVAFVRPSEHLHVSYAMADMSGGALRPSRLVRQLQNLLPGLNCRTNLAPELQKEALRAPRAALDRTLDRLGDFLEGEPIEDFWWDVARYFMGTPARDALEEFMRRLGARRQDDIPAELAGKLYGGRGSVSRLDRYARCPFGHFVAYGLRPEVRREYKLMAMDEGTILHRVVERVMEELMESGRDFDALTERDVHLMVDRAWAKMEDFDYGVLKDSRRLAYLGERLHGVIRRSVWMLVQQVKASRFEPRAVEWSFGKGGTPPIEVELPGGGRAQLMGTVDRIDVCPGEREDYVRIIDYKSGRMPLRLAEVMAGLKLQLLLYMDAVLETHKGKPLRPAGMLYLSLTQPLVDDIETDKLEEALMKAFQMKGLVVDDVEVLSAMDTHLPGESTSLILPVALKKDGGVRKTPFGPVPEEALVKLMAKAKKLAGSMLAAAGGGGAAAHPLRMDTWNACQSCEYQSICRFDGRRDRYRRVQNQGDGKVLEDVMKEEKP